MNFFETLQLVGVETLFVAMEEIVYAVAGINRGCGALATFLGSYETACGLLDTIN